MKTPQQQSYDAGDHIDPHLRQRFFVAAKRGDDRTLRGKLMLQPRAANWRLGGKSVLQAAVEHRQPVTASTLLEEKADPNAPSDDGLSSPMIAAARNDDVFMLVKLIHAGGQAHRVNGGDETPLMNAIRHDAAGAVTLLVTHGASRTQYDSEQNGPLHVATSSGSFNAAEALLKSGVDINTPNGETLTPLMLAAKEKNLAGAKFLLDNGADDTLLSDLRETALDMARAFAGGGREFLAGYEALMQARLTARTEAFLPQMRKGTSRSIIAPEPAKFKRK